jgi:hypothetical protein
VGGVEERLHLPTRRQHRDPLSEQNGGFKIEWSFEDCSGGVKDTRTSRATVDPAFSITRFNRLFQAALDWMSTITKGRDSSCRALRISQTCQPANTAS